MPGSSLTALAALASRVVSTTTAPVITRVELAEVDRRRLAFRVEVRDELDEAGKGTHERFIIDSAQRLPRLQQKLDRWQQRPAG